MKRTRLMLAAAALLLVLTAFLPHSIPQARSDEGAPAGLEDLSWLAGSWGGREKGEETEEHWITPKGGMMLGANRTVRESGKTSFEFLRIAKTDRGISYFGSPGGGPATEFPLVELAERRVMFENKQHDFPQRISYRLGEDGPLIARVEGEVNGQTRSFEWRWDPIEKAAAGAGR